MRRLPKRLKKLRPKVAMPTVIRPVEPPGRTGATVEWTAAEQQALNDAFARGDRETVTKMMKEKSP